MIPPAANSLKWTVRNLRRRGPAPIIGRCLLFRRRRAFAFFLLLLLGSATRAQVSGGNTWKPLYDAGRFRELAANTDASADAALYKGLALARLDHAEQAKQVLLDAQRQYPHDARFPTELGGLFFQSKDYPKAIGHLQRAVRLNPADNYANNFLGSLYLLEGNLEAALKYWNRVGRPTIDQIQFLPEPRISPVLLDLTMAISPRSVLH